MKKMVTDAKTGERTAIVTTNVGGQSEWTVTKEYDDDIQAGKEKQQRWSAKLNLLRRAIDV